MGQAVQPAPAGNQVCYERRHIEDTTLYTLLKPDHAAHAAVTDTDAHRPRSSRPSRAAAQESLTRRDHQYRDAAAGAHAAARRIVPRPRPHLIRFHGVLASHVKRRAAIDASPAHQATEHAADHAHAHDSAPARMDRARLLKPAFDSDTEYYPRCGGRLQIIAAIVDPPMIAKILAHLHLPARAPSRSPARAPALFRAA